MGCPAGPPREAGRSQRASGRGSSAPSRRSRREARRLAARRPSARPSSSACSSSCRYVGALMASPSPRRRTDGIRNVRLPDKRPLVRHLRNPRSRARSGVASGHRAGPPPRGSSPWATSPRTTPPLREVGEVDQGEARRAEGQGADDRLPDGAGRRWRGGRRRGGATGARPTPSTAAVDGPGSEAWGRGPRGGCDPADSLRIAGARTCGCPVTVYLSPEFTGGTTRHRRQR